MNSPVAPLKKAVFSYLNKRQSRWRKIETRNIPYYELGSEHVHNTRLLHNREALLEVIPKHGTVAELGVDQGEFSQLIKSITQPDKLHLIDLWGSERYGETKRKQVEALFADDIAAGKVEINRGYSTEQLEKFEDHYFDWIYIDTDHTYNTTAKELVVCRRKVRPGGLIMGHDYVKANWEGNMRYGVIEAVNEFCIKENWEFLYMTAETHQHRSFCIRQIQ